MTYWKILLDRYQQRRYLGRDGTPQHHSGVAQQRFMNWRTAWLQECMGHANPWDKPNALREMNKTQALLDTVGNFEKNI